MAKRILRLKEVKTRTGLARSTIYLRIAQGSFPKSIALGERAVGWLESDLDEWINERIRQSHQDGGHD
ncbi:AlpA family transcriptional regulator [Pseudomonadales bacterium]|nr:AlpA family transcriptional regulator [Pseudomonadales bacterium]